MTRTLLLLMILLACLPGCKPPVGQDVPDVTPGLQSFASEKDVQDYLKVAVMGTNAAASQPTIPPYGPGTVVCFDPVADGVGGLEPSMPGLPNSNLPARARTDGAYLYVLTDYDLSVVQTSPAEQMKALGRFELMDWPMVTALYLFDRRAVVVTGYTCDYGYGWTYMIGDDWLPLGEDFFEVGVIDVQDPANPRLLRHYWFQGDPLASQVVDGKLVLVSANYPADPYNTSPPDFETLTASDILPKYRMVDENSNETVDSLITWQNIRRPASPDGSAITTITTLDVTGEPAKPAATALMAYWEYLYITPTALYMTDAPCTPDGQGRSDTQIHKYDLAGSQAQYTATGKVAGRPAYSCLWASSSSFSQKDDLLRVVMSPQDRPGFDLVMLRHVDNQLRTVSQLEDIAADLDAFTFAFAGDHLFVYDYDLAKSPLHVDLADPLKPQKVGQVDLSRAVGCMHMIDATHLMVVGYEALTDDPNGRTFGDLCLWMFDLADPGKPDLLHHEVIGSGASSSGVVSSAYHDTLALSGGLMALPVSLYEGTYPPGIGVLTFGGQYIYRVSISDGFQRLGRIGTLSAYYYNAWEQVFFQGDTILSVSNAAAKAAALSNPDLIISDIRVPGV